MAKNDKHNLIKRNDTWYFVAMHNGKRFHEALSTNLKEAKQLRNTYLDNLKRYGCMYDGKQKVYAHNEGQPQLLFGEVAEEWVGIQQKRVAQGQIKFTTLRDYKSAMNRYILPYFGNMPINTISAYHVDDFVLSLEVSGKRKKNILVPMKSLFKLAKKKCYVDNNIMEDIEKIDVIPSKIFPLSSDEVKLFLEATTLVYRQFFTTLFYTGMRFGEAAALKWKNVDFERNQISIVETRVAGEEGVTKTKRNRVIDMLPPVKEALKIQQELGVCKKYVFRDKVGNLLTPDHARKQVWIPVLDEICLEYRPMIQTRHTFATIAIESGESLGWVQKMLGHSSLQMIMTTYYGWIKRPTEMNGSAMMESMMKGEVGEQPVAI